ncbi:MAG: tetratricopeptide repeat protein, partial [Myxococcales bacterium]
MVARLRFLLPTLLLTLAMTPGARAQAPTPAPVSAERLDQARRHMDEGQSLYARGRFAEAAQAFRQAYTVQPFAAFLFNEAVCHEKAGDSEQALATFRRYLTADPNPPDAEALRARIKRLEEAVARGAASTAPAPPAEARNDAMHSLLVFESNPPGAPAQLWHRAEPTAGPFDPAGPNPGWK